MRVGCAHEIVDITSAEASCPCGGAMRFSNEKPAWLLLFNWIWFCMQARADVWQRVSALNCDKLRVYREQFQHKARCV